MDQNKALEQRYKDRFHAFVMHCNEHVCQNTILQDVVTRIALGRQALFKRKGMLDIVDFGCGPGEMSLLIQKLFEGFNPEGARINALEMNKEHMVAAQQMLAHSVIIPEDIFTTHIGLKQQLNLTQDPAAIFISHAGYYGFKKGSKIQPGLTALADNIAALMGKETIGFLYHKAPEPTNILKQKYSNVIESDTTKALKQILDKKGMANFGVTFQCNLTVPAIEDGLWKELENPLPYPKSNFANGKEVRDLLEFLIHKGLEELSHHTRKNFLADARQLIESHKGVIPTFVEQRLVLSPQAPKSFKEYIHKINEDIRKAYHSEMVLAA